MGYRHLSYKYFSLTLIKKRYLVEVIFFKFIKAYSFRYFLRLYQLKSEMISFTLLEKLVLSWGYFLVPINYDIYSIFIFI